MILSCVSVEKIDKIKLKIYFPTQFNSKDYENDNDDSQIASNNAAVRPEDRELPNPGYLNRDEESMHQGYAQGANKKHVPIGHYEPMPVKQKSIFFKKN